MMPLAVVKLRQQERQWVREKERLQEIQAVSEAHLQSQLTQMEEQLHAVEKERNIFMVGITAFLYTLFNNI